MTDTADLPVMTDTPDLLVMTDTPDLPVMTANSNLPVMTANSTHPVMTANSNLPGLFRDLASASTVLEAARAQAEEICREEGRRGELGQAGKGLDH